MWFVFLRGIGDLDAAAERLRAILNIPKTNRRPMPRDQRRYSRNRGGGWYYLFGALGLYLSLVSNSGEVEIEERADWPFYVIVEGPHGADREAIGAIARYLSFALNRAGLETIAEDVP